MGRVFAVDEKNSDKIILTDREILDVNGVINVEKFTDDEIILETNQGQLQIKGEKMYMKQLSLDAGLIVVEGNIKALIYHEGSTSKQKGKNLLGRLLR
jgi:sporulation protein YabP